jgi:hypothetical protein
MGQALGALVGEAVALAWWVNALKGDTLDHLHFQWEVGMSTFKIFQRWRFRGWFCAAGVAFTAFAGLEALLQTASFPVTVLSSYQADMTIKTATAFPAGFSGVIGSSGHDSFGPMYFTPTFVQVLQNYTAQSPIHIDADGCPPGPNAWCGVNIKGVGFQYTCTAARSSLNYATGGISPSLTVFQVAFKPGGWSIELQASWKDQPEQNGTVISSRNCTLVPAIVEYPVNVTQQTVTLEPAISTVKWTSNSTNIGMDKMQVDKVLQILPFLDYDKRQEEVNYFDTGVGTHDTLGGLALAFSQLFDSSITVMTDPTNFGARMQIQGSFVAPYAHFDAGTQNDEILKNNFTSPMDSLLDHIRDISFRTSMAIVNNNVPEFVIHDNAGTVTTDSPGTHVPSSTSSQKSSYFIYETVYRTNKRILGAGVGLMLFALLVILSLYRGFWRLGRQVSLAPIDIAKALHYSTTMDPDTEALIPHSVLDLTDDPDRPPYAGSVLSSRELVGLLANVKVKYGEVAPSVLGIGLSEHTNVARKGVRYI